MKQRDKKAFCYRVCPEGKAYFEELMNTSESAFDAAFDFEVFCSKCYENCPHHMSRDWENPDGIEWWKMKNFEHHTWKENGELKPIGMLMSIERYRELIKGKYFIPYDGWGYYCTENEFLEEKSDYYVDLIDKKIKKGYKYVIWYNK